MKYKTQNGRLLSPRIWAIPLLLSASAACSRPPEAPVEGISVEPKEAKIVQDRTPGPPVANLPSSQGRSFTSLDEYLAFLRKRGAYDVPFYDEVSPGVYELVMRRPPGMRAQTFTRAELEAKFGFTK